MLKGIMVGTGKAYLLFNAIISRGNTWNNYKTEVGSVSLNCNLIVTSVAKRGRVRLEGILEMERNIPLKQVTSINVIII